jgi:UDP-N-acetylmuramoyl-tripeptide--D-alanyl-D-alanine ligase
MRSRGNFGYGFTIVQDPIWTLSQILLATGGRFICGPIRASFRSIATDTRAIQPGDIFLALVGENFDGHDFVFEAVARGAAGIIVSRPVEVTSVSVVQVGDTLKALGDLAGFRRQQIPDLQVLAITGSSGKTTVKEMTAAILAREYKILKTRGNLNNLIGMPLTLLAVDYRHEAAILEMGMNHPGEIARLTEIADPDICCILNVHDAHLAGLGDIDGVARAKGEMFAGGKSWAKLVVNLDDKRVRAMARQYSQEKITFGRSSKAMIRATHIRNCGEEGMVFTLHVDGSRERIAIKAIGYHNVLNSLAAAALAFAAGSTMVEIIKGLTGFIAFDKRLQIEETVGLKIINDTYNANPASMAAAFAALQGLKGTSRTVAVLGDMLELGEKSELAHRRLGENAACQGFDYIFIIGKYSHLVAQGALDAGMKRSRIKNLQTREDIVAGIKQLVDLGELGPGDWLLVKGSRSMGMEKVIAGLKKFMIN